MCAAMPGSLAIRFSESSSTGRQYSVLRMPSEYAFANSLVGCGHNRMLSSVGAQCGQQHADGLVLGTICADAAPGCRWRSWHRTTASAPLSCMQSCIQSVCSYFTLGRSMVCSQDTTGQSGL